MFYSIDRVSAATMSTYLTPLMRTKILRGLLIAIIVLAFRCHEGASSFMMEPAQCHHQSTALKQGSATEETPSWKQYCALHHSPLKHSFHKAGGILYRTSVFSKAEFAAIQKDLEQQQKLLIDETTNTVATNRMGAVLCPENSKTVDIFKTGSLTTLVQLLMGQDYHLSSHVPVELRTYEKIGAGMQWHVDDVLYDPPQLEVVWTLENTSDCQTMWIEDDAAATTLRTVETDANSVVLLKAGGVQHCVSSLKQGKRIIVKCVYIKEGARFNAQELVAQFGSKRNRTRKRRQ